MGSQVEDLGKAIESLSKMAALIDCNELKHHAYVGMAVGLGSQISDDNASILSGAITDGITGHLSKIKNRSGDLLGFECVERDYSVGAGHGCLLRVWAPGNKGSSRDVVKITTKLTSSSARNRIYVFARVSTELSVDKRPLAGLVVRAMSNLCEQVRDDKGFRRFPHGVSKTFVSDTPFDSKYDLLSNMITGLHGNRAMEIKG